jgi:glycosyltransferase involved in cell wall biosynthesis
MPYFSVILPTYNRAHLLPKAIQSLVDQTFGDWELIIVDDGSTDDTKAVVEKFQDERIRYVYQENQERSAARNNGINQAKGTFICFLDSDDYFLKDKLTNLYTAQQGSKNNSIWFDGLISEHNGSQKRLPFPVIENGYNNFEFILSNTLFSQQICGNIEIFKLFQFNPSIRIGEDMELWFRIASEFTFIPIEKSYQTVILEHDDRSINIKKGNVYLEQLQTLKLILSSKQSNNVRNSIKRTTISNCQFNIAKHFMYNNNKIKSIIWIVKSINNDLNNIQLKHRLYCLMNLLFFKIPSEYQ